MSISNLFEPNHNQIYVGSFNIVDTPILNLSDNNYLVRNIITGEIEINTSGSGSETVTGAINNGTGQPIYSLDVGGILNFNTLTGNSAQGVTISPPSSGNVEINNTFLNQSVKTTDSVSFVGVVTDISGSTANSLGANTFSNSTSIGIDNTTKDLVTITDIMSTDTAQTVSAVKTFTATPIISNIGTPGGNIAVPSGISSIMALQSAGAQTINNVCSYFNTSPTPAVIKDSGIATSSLVTLAGLVTANYNLENSQPISNNTDSIVIYDTVNLTSPSISYNFGTGLFTINKAGIYTFNATTLFTTNPAGTRGVYFTYNANTLHYSNMYISSSGSTTNTEINNSFTNKFAINDTVSLIAFQNSGIGINIEGNDDDASSFTNIYITGITSS